MNNFARQWADVRDEALPIVDAVGTSGWYVLGERVRQFEADLAVHWGARQAVGVASGLDAIELALRALGLRPGDRVLTTPLSAFATTLAIVRLGGIPVFCDTDELGLIDLEAARCVLRTTPGIRFFVPVHLYGFPVEPGELRDLVQEFRLICVEDCAQSIGAMRCSQPCGLIGQAAATSFYPTKNLGAMGDGGAVLTNDTEVAQKVRSLRDYGQSAKYVHSEIGANSRLDELQAALLANVFLPRLPHWTARRRQIAARYLGGWSSQQVEPLGQLASRALSLEPCWHLFPVRVAPERKPSLLEWLRSNGIGFGEHYPILIPDQTALSNCAFVCDGNLQNARTLASGEVSLPIHPYITDAEADRVLEIVHNWRANGCS